MASVFMNMRRGRCPDCNEGLLQGDGKCGQCNGTGVNTQLDSDQPQCPYCRGTGVCATCGGSGLPDGNPIQSLFS